MNAKLQAGTEIDRYYLVRRLLGSSLSSDVYEVYHRYTHKSAALKLVAPGAPEHERLGVRLHREAELLERARGVGVPELYFVGTCPKYGPYMVTTLLEGRTLDGLLVARKKLGVQEVVLLGLQLAEILQRIHARGVVHRDVKPGNIYLCPHETGDRVVLFDFNISIAAEVGARGGNRSTNLGEILGTLEYMAPEQMVYSEGGLDPRMDLYALGATLYECLTGHLPHPEPMHLVKSLPNTPPPLPVRSLRSEVSPALSVLLHSLLSRDPYQRPLDAYTLALAFRKLSNSPDAKLSLLKGTPQQGVQATNAPSVPRRRKSRAPYVAPVRLLPINEASVDGRIEDISEGGAMAIANQSLEVGSFLRCKVALPCTGKMVSLDAVVRWNHAARGRFALGLEFLAVTKSVADELKNYVRWFGEEDPGEELALGETQPAPLTAAG